MTRVAGVARDVTARKQVDEALRESERRFREMLENVELIAMTLDRQGIVTFCNDHLLKLTGWSREEVIGATWCANFLPENCEAEQLFFAHIEAGTIPVHHQNAIQTRSGELREIVWNNMMLRDEAGQIVGTASIGEDVTERRLAEERVREQAAMLDHAHEAIIVREIESGRITFWNRGAERVYGWTAEEAIGREIGELICVEPEIQKEITQQLLKTGEWHGERKHLSKAGKILTISSHATLVCDAKGRPKSALVINIDVTEQKSLQEQFLRAQRLEGIGTLASGVAHDLNNVLSPILMSVPLLEDALAGTRSASLVSIIEQSRPARHGHRPPGADFRARRRRRAHVRAGASSPARNGEYREPDFSAFDHDSELGADRSVAGHRRRHPAPAGAAQPLRERARCDARRRHAHLARGERADRREFRRHEPRRETWALSPGHGGRYRRGHRAGNHAGRFSTRSSPRRKLARGPDSAFPPRWAS